MHKRSRDSLPGSIAPVLTASILSCIHELNSDYVELLIAAEGSAAALPASVVAGLAALPVAARQALAACPFALYSLDLEHHDFWRSSLARPAYSASGMRYRLHESLSQGRCFSTSALFFAWHVVSSQRMAAKVVYGIPDSAIDALARMKLWELQRIAAGCAGLRPQWPTNSCFWPDLVRFAAIGDISRLTTTQLLGSQLIAADLRNSSARTSLSRSTLRFEDMHEPPVAATGGLL